MQPNDDNLAIALMEAASRSLDITDDQRKQVEASYAAVGQALCADPSLAKLSPHIQPQGSFLYGTVVKPGPDSDFDVDATCRLRLNHQVSPSGDVFNAVFRVLKAHGIYAEMVEPKNRCIRINYAAAYHLDMTPCVPNSAAEEAIHVPDRELKCCKPSNPQLYAKLFEEVAAVQPRFDFEKESSLTVLMANEARIDPLPPDAGFRKALLKRIVQLMKKHRDLHFEGKDHQVISIIITTLAAKAYDRSVQSRSYGSIMDFVNYVVADMPNHIVREENLGRLHYNIPNPAILTENFADKWNNEPRLPKAFYEWHGAFTAGLQQYEAAAISKKGNHYLAEQAGRLYGKQAALLAANTISDRIADQHRRETLMIGPTISLASSGIAAPKTSYYGR